MKKYVVFGMQCAMKKWKALGTVGLVAATLGCGPGRCVDPANVTYRITRPDELAAGKKMPVVLEVRNKTEDFMLVEKVTGDQVLADGHDSLVGAETGSLTKSANGKSWVLNPVAQQETPAVFAYGLIPPGQSLRIWVNLVPTAAEGEVAIHYRAFCAKGAARWLYFPSGEMPQAGLVFSKVPPEMVEKEAETKPAEGERHPFFARVIAEEELLESSPPCKMDMPYRLALPE